MNYNLEEDSGKIKRVVKECIILLIEILFVILLAYLLIQYALIKTTMIGDSMNTTLADGDKIIVNKMAYSFTKPKRFDIIVFKQSGKEHTYSNIKRVIALPGEMIQIVNGIIYINESPLEEKFLVSDMTNGGLAEDKIILDENEYFVLGDNRNHSEDSRFANIGSIVSNDIIGKAWIRLDPFNFVNKINTIKNK